MRARWTILFAALSTGTMATPAVAEDFGIVTLKPDQTTTVQLTGSIGDVRVCNDATSASTITATIQPRDPMVLRPGECDQNRGWAIELHNIGVELAKVVYLRLMGTDVF
jgi:hypothetical protein